MPAAGKRGIPDRIDPTVDAVQSTAPDPLPHGARKEPELNQLGQRDDAVLPLCQRGDRRIRTASGEFRLYVWRNSPLASHGWMVAPSASRFSTRR
jgi:hypothetical protein